MHTLIKVNPFQKVYLKRRLITIKEIGKELLILHNEDFLDRWRGYTQELSLNNDHLSNSKKITSYALSEIMGYSNPNAVSGLIIENALISIENEDYLIEKNIANRGIASSLEMRQIDSLIKVAGYQKKAMYFNWLDIVGDSNANLGFNLIEQVKVDRSVIRELRLRQDKIEKSINRKSAEAVSRYNNAIDEVKKLKQLALVRERIWIRSKNQLLECIINSQSLCPNIEGVIKDFQKVLDVKLELEGEYMKFRINNARIDRITLQGFYTKLRYNTENYESDTYKIQREDFFTKLGILR